MRRKKRNTVNPRVLVIIIGGLLMILGLVLVAQGMVDTRGFRDALIRGIKERTGQELTIQGQVSVSLLPVPTIYLPNVQLRGAGEDARTPMLSVDMIYARISPMTLFSQPRVTGLRLFRPRFEIERSKEGFVRWKWLDKALVQELLLSPSAGPVSVSVEQGQLLYRSHDGGGAMTLHDLNFRMAGGAKPALVGSVVARDHVLDFDVRLDKGGDSRPFKSQLQIGEEGRLTLDGTFDWSGDTPVINGAFSLESADVLPLLAGRSDEVEVDVLGNPQPAAAQPAVTLPVSLQAAWKMAGKTVQLADAQLASESTNGKGTIGFDWEKPIPRIAIDMDFTHLDANRWRAAISRLFPSRAAVTAGYGADRDAVQENPLPEDINVLLDVTAQDFVVGAQTWDKAEIRIELSDGAVTVNRFHIELPGQSTLSLFGLVSQGNSKALRFEGSVEASGKNLRNFLTIFDESAADLPDTGFGDFYVRSNIFMSPEQTRLSEADVKINELQLSGGLVAYYDQRPRVEAEVNLREINFDYFRDLWRKRHFESKHPDPHDFFLKFDRGMSFNWLKNLHTSVDFRINVEDFTFLDRKGQSASFRLFAQEGEFGIYNMRFYYPNDVMEANIHLDAKGDTPKVNLVVSAHALDVGYFMAEPPAGTAAPSAPAEVLPPAEEDTAPVSPEAAPVPAPAPEAPQLPPQPGASLGVEEKLVSLLPQTQRVPLPDHIELPVPPAPPRQVVALGALQPAAGGDEPAPAQQRWSEELIDTSWMEGVGGQFDISINRLTYGDKVFERFKMSATLEDRVFSFRGLSFGHWQGTCELSGSVYGGKVPGMSVGFTLYNAELRDMFADLSGIDNIGGRVSASGTFATSGVNMLSWVQQADSKLVISGRGVDVEGFDLQGVSDTVAVSRTASDVVANVNRVLLKGRTQMSVDGNVNIKGGVVRTPGITLKTGSIVGNLTGEVNLVPWTMDLSTLFQFAAMTSETTPTMTVELHGPIDDPALTTDTSSLEAYVAKRIIGR